MKYQKKLKSRLIYVTSTFFLALFTSALICTQFELEDYTYGFLTGFLGSIGIIMIVSIVQYNKMKKNPDLMRKEQIKEEDERNCMIQQKTYSLGLRVVILINAMIAIVFSFIDPKIAMLISCELWLSVIVIGVLYMYYKKKL